MGISALSVPGSLALHALLPAVLAAVAALPGAAHASQVLEVREGDTTVVRLSIRDQTRLRVASGRIVDVIGDVFDAQRNPGGRIAVLKDDADGEVYLKPAPISAAVAATGAPAAAQAPIKLDVKTTRGTVGLLLQPADVVGQTLTLRISGGQSAGAASGATAAGPWVSGDAAEPRGKGVSHVRAVKALTLAMAAPGLAPEVPVQAVPGGQELALWVEARFVLRARYEAAGLVGEAFTLTNVSNARMVIDERELFKPGVLSVSVRHLALEPGQMTPVWIVRLPDSGDTSGSDRGALAPARR